MNLILDLLLLVIVILFAVRASRKSVQAAVLQVGVIAVSFVLSLLLSLAVSGSGVKDSLFGNRFAHSAAGDMADMVSATRFENGYETIKAVDVEKLLRENSESMNKLLDQYNVTKDQITGDDAVGEAKNQVMLRQIVDPAARDLTQAVFFLALFILFEIILSFSLRPLLEKKAVRAALKKNKALSTALGLLAGLLAVYFVYSTLVGLAAPYDVGLLRVMGLKDGLAGSLLTRFFCSVNFLL